MTEKILVLDTETANTIEDALVYNVGAIITDRKGIVYDSFSAVNSDVFFGKQELMQSAYYAAKIPQYLEQIRNNDTQVMTLYEIRAHIRAMMEKWNCKIVCAHNARFDYNALNTTQRYETCSKYRYFLPYGVTIWDTQKMAHDTICKQKRYIKFCAEHGFVTKTGRVHEKAETLYRYITKDISFQEEHKALEDVQIEIAILAHCFRQHKKMRKKLWERG